MLSLQDYLRLNTARIPLMTEDFVSNVIPPSHMLLHHCFSCPATSDAANPYGLMAFHSILRISFSDVAGYINGDAKVLKY
jgi:hypothetical protein